MELEESNIINPYVIKSIDYIKKNIKNKITINEVCNHVNLSKYYFSRIFKQAIGITPYKYILKCKIEGVKKDLKSGIDINTVANNYGFYDLSHLNKNFIKVYGITPLEFQESCKNKKK